MSERLLIRSSGNWGDEFDLNGFCIINRDMWEKAKEGIPEGSFDTYLGGSNTLITFRDKEDYLSHIEEIPISEEDEEALIRLLNLKKYRPDWIITYGIFVISSEYW